MKPQSSEVTTLFISYPGYSVIRKLASQFNVIHALAGKKLRAATKRQTTKISGKSKKS